MAANPKPSSPTPHGTIGGYTNHHCRCAPCTAVASKNHARYMAANPAQRERARLYSIKYNARKRAERDSH